MDEPVTDSPQNCTSACIHSLCTRTTSVKIRDNKNGLTILQSWIFIIITINTTAGSYLVLTTLCWLLELINRLGHSWLLSVRLAFSELRGKLHSTWPLLTTCLLTLQARVSQSALRTLGPDHSLLWGWHPSLYPWDASSTPSQMWQPLGLLTLPNVLQLLEDTAPGQAPASPTFSRIVSLLPFLPVLPTSLPGILYQAARGSLLWGNMGINHFLLTLQKHLAMQDEMQGACLASKGPALGFGSLFWLHLLTLTLLIQFQSPWHTFSSSHLPGTAPLQGLCTGCSLLPQITGRFTPLFYSDFVYLPWPA